MQAHFTSAVTLKPSLFAAVFLPGCVRFDCTDLTWVGHCWVEPIEFVLC